jgi:hypothetical protein
MVIGAEDEAELAEPVAAVLPVELLLLLLHAARAPTPSAMAPSTTAFLENQGRFALTPGSSFLIAYLSSGLISKSDTRLCPGRRLRGVRRRVPCAA